MINPDDIKELRTQFEAIDKDKSGMLCVGEMKTFLQGSDVKQIIKEVDLNGNGKINYSEFLSATIDINDFLSRNEIDIKLRSIF